MADTTQPSASSTTSSSGGAALGGLFGSANPVGAAVNAAATIANTIAGISDLNKRRLIEANLQYLSQEDQQALAESIARSNNKNDQATILVNTVMAAQNAAADRAQKTQTVKWILIGGAGIATIFIIAWYFKK